jgi:HD superfamily phosphohydrolase
MQKVIDHLQLIHDLGQGEMDHLMKAGLAASMLHDIGHGPLSHCSEPILKFDHEDVTSEIITRPPISDILEKDDIEPDIVVKIIKHRVSRNDALVSQLVSSELDVDRLDYLSRDSYFTGAGYGNIDRDRIVTMLRVCPLEGPLKRHLVSLFKGRYSIESYVLGRHLMYQALYFHRATRGAEKLLAAAFRRAIELQTPGLIPEDLQFITSESKREADDIMNLDDHRIFNTLRDWQTNKDRVLSTICKRILQRNLLKAIELTPERSTAYLTGVQDKFIRLAKGYGIEPEYFCPIDGASETSYSVYRIKSQDDETKVVRSIFVYDDKNEPREISELSDVVRQLSKTHFLDRLYMPDKIRVKAMRLFGSK